MGRRELAPEGELLFLEATFVPPARPLRLLVLAAVRCALATDG